VLPAFCHKVSEEKSKRHKKSKSYEKPIKIKVVSWFALCAGGIASWSGK
jgi:hypothetical protein